MELREVTLKLRSEEIAIIETYRKRMNDAVRREAESYGRPAPAEFSLELCAESLLTQALNAWLERQREAQHV